MSSAQAVLIDKGSAELGRRLRIYMSQRGVASLQRLSIEVDGGIVTLRGTVSSFYERQLCLCCQHVAGVIRLVDDLKVESPFEKTLDARPPRGC